MRSVFSKKMEGKVERLIQISKTKPLLPEEFVPWDTPIMPDTQFLPDGMISLQGHEWWSRLSRQQQLELGRLEVTQVMYSYAWSEALANNFFNRHLLTISPTSVEYRFLLREIIEECRHQEMFSTAIEKLARDPIPPSGWHRWLGKFTVRYCPASLVFISVLTVELMADIYAKHLRRDENVYLVLRKCSELHHIEEGRHIFYAEAWLAHFTENAGYLKTSLYSLMVLLNVYFLKSLYLQQQFFEQIGCTHPELFYRAAKKQYDQKFPLFAMSEIIEFVHRIKGFNALTRPLWRWIMKVQI